MSAGTCFVGWDVGGAHLKFAQIDSAGQLVRVQQIPCPLWRGVVTLDKAFSVALPAVENYDCSHLVTMTGELSDIFLDRRQGVQALSERILEHLGPSARFFAGIHGFVTASELEAIPEHVASANWLATGRYVAQCENRCLLIDMGSTTTDLVLVNDGRVAPSGSSDADRLTSQELLYSGAVRTPVMAIVQQVPFAGQWQGVMAERFATMADVYVLTGQLTADMLRESVHFETADGSGTEQEDCARRLARMLGRDSSEAGHDSWRGVACFIAERQLDMLMQALRRVYSRLPDAIPPLLIGAGVGRFVVEEAARRLCIRYQDFSEFVHGSASLRNAAALCAPSTALAYLLRYEHT